MFLRKLHNRPQPDGAPFRPRVRARPAAAQNLSARAFTVLELMIVIGVLSVLLSIVLPTIKTVRASALRNRAKVEATALAQAAIHYKTEYGFWPGQLAAKADDTVELLPAFKAQGDNLISAIISGPTEFTKNLTFNTGATPVYLNENEVYRAFRRVGDMSGLSYKPNPLNPKGIRFLDLTDESDPSRVDFLDPWGRSYILFMGLNPSTTFTHTLTLPDGGKQTITVRNAIAFAFSYGEDGDRSTNYLYSAGVAQ